MKMIKKDFFQVAVLTAGLCLSSASFAKEEFFFVLEFGRADLDLDSKYRTLHESEEDDASVGSGTFGYKFESNIVLAGNLASSFGDQLFDTNDNYEIYEAGVLLGYSIDLAKHFRIVPSVGLSVWELDIEEGQLGNPGPEERLEEHGVDIYGKINFEFPLNDRFQFNAIYTYGDYDFGVLQSSRIGLKFAF